MMDSFHYMSGQMKARTIKGPEPPLARPKRPTSTQVTGRDEIWGQRPADSFTAGVGNG